MRNRTLTLLLFAVMASATAMVGAVDFVSGGLCYEMNADGHSVTLSGYTEAPAQLVVPTEVTDEGVTYAVTAIGEKAFYCCKTLTSITIPNTVVTIGDMALHVTGLTSLTIPGSVTSIGEEAFSGCTDLAGISVMSGNPRYDSRDDCNAIIETASNQLIVGCKNTVIPNSVTGIGTAAFYGCYGLKNMVVPSSVTAIGVRAFCDCDSLTSVVIPNSVSNIDKYAFYSCISLASVDIPNSVTAIADGAFAHCWGLTSVTIPNSVTIIGNDAFLNCGSLPSVTIPGSVTGIGKTAFYNCTELSSVTIPNSVSYVGYKAFHGTAWFASQPNGLVYAGLVAYNYKGAMPSGTSVDIAEGTKGIAENAFARFGNLAAVMIPNSLTIIGQQAFSFCIGLTSVQIPGSVNFIGDEAFAYCRNLASIEAYPNPADIVLGDFVFYAIPTENTLHVLPEYLEAYKNADQWKDFRNIVGDLAQSRPSGDITGDGNVDIADVNAAINMMLGKTEQTATADVTGDGQVDIADVNAIINTMLGK